jgi:hypothetical protein
MLSPIRIGSVDPYWVQTRDAVLQRAQHLGIELLPIDTNSTSSLGGDSRSRLWRRCLPKTSPR